MGRRQIRIQNWELAVKWGREEHAVMMGRSGKQGPLFSVRCTFIFEYLYLTIYPPLSHMIVYQGWGGIVCMEDQTKREIWWTGLQVCEWDDWAFPWNAGLVECGCPFVDRKWALACLCVGVRVNTSCPPCRRSSFGLIGIDLIDRFTSSPKWKHVKHVHVLWSSRFVACNWCQLIIGQNRVARSFIFNELLIFEIKKY